jgi:cytidine deaminase
MEEIKTTSTIQQYTSATELSLEDQQLLNDAKAAVNTSYAPYSRFHVGCALILENGVIIKGSNQENIAYPSGLCAERVAIFHAGASYPDVPVRTMAITVKAEGYVVDKPITSCGSCLQSMSEFELKFNKPMRIILQGETGNIWVADSLRTFIPFMFWVDELTK